MNIPIKLLTILFLLIGHSSLFSQRKDLTLVPFEKEGKWGYKNVDFNIIVPPIYEEAYPTYYGRGRFKINGKYGFIDHQGQVAIKPKYDKAKDFYAGVTTVIKKGKKKAIGTDGKEITFGSVLCGAIFSNCIQRVPDPSAIYKKDGKYGLSINFEHKGDIGAKKRIDTLLSQLDTIIYLDSYNYLAKKNGKYGHVNLYAIQLNYNFSIFYQINFEFEDIRFFQFYDYEDYTDQFFALKENGKWGYYELGGAFELEKITEHNYISVSSMCRGYALVEYEKDKFGWVSSRGIEYFK